MSRRPPVELSREFDPTRVYRNEIAGGPMSESYESLVRNIFHPESGQRGPPLPPSFGPPQQGTSAGQRILLGSSRPKISAAAMRRIEEQLGKDALDDSNDDQLWKSPIDEIYQELGIDPCGPVASGGFPVYAPKSSSEYFSTASALPPAISSHRSSNLGTYRLVAPSSLRPSYSSLSSDMDEGGKGSGRWRENNRQTLVDYKDFYSSPLSPYLYRGSVQNQDSRILGSNFVQLTTRPKDRFLEKIDKTLAEIRSTPRYGN